MRLACFGHCQNPVELLVHHYRPGLLGAWRMGVAHGTYCVGCCWLLMLLLLFVGVMDLRFIAVLTAFVTLERLTPPALQLGKIAGAALVLAGLAALVVRR